MRLSWGSAFEGFPDPLSSLSIRFLKIDNLDGTSAVKIPLKVHPISTQV
jgi:hypothetical protein